MKDKLNHPDKQFLNCSLFSFDSIHDYRVYHYTVRQFTKCDEKDGNEKNEIKSDKDGEHGKR